MPAPKWKGLASTPTAGSSTTSIELWRTTLAGTGLVNLDEVRTFFELFTDYGDEFGGIVRVSSVGQDVLLRIVADGIFVPPRILMAFPLIRRREPRIWP